MTHAPAAPQFRTLNVDRLAAVCLWLLAAASGFVLFEPAPFDLAVIAMFALAVLFGIRLPRSAMLMVVLLAAWLLFSLIGTARAPQIEYHGTAIRHMQITGLLICVSIFFACVVYRFRDIALNAVMSGWVAAALLASLVGILGYFDLLGPYSEHALLYGRVKGTFKDPNVLAPFLVPPALYCVYLAASRNALWSLLNLGILLVLVLALFLSFSRGGWGNFVLTGLVAVVLWFMVSSERGFRLRLVVFMVLAAGALSIALVSVLDLQKVGDLFASRIAVQEYDSAEYGRFAGQYLAFMKALDNPFGLGARGFLPEWHEQPHNVYIFQLIIGGWFGAVAYLAFVAVTLVRALAFVQLRTPHTGLMVVLFASFFGVAAEGLIVDTDHWRHFWVLAGLIWGLTAIYDGAPRRTAVGVDAPLSAMRPAPRSKRGQAPIPAGGP